MVIYTAENARLYVLMDTLLLVVIKQHASRTKLGITHQHVKVILLLLPFDCFKLHVYMNIDVIGDISIKLFQYCNWLSEN
jgi:hypothetical protein